MPDAVSGDTAEVLHRLISSTIPEASAQSGHVIQLSGESSGFGLLTFDDAPLGGLIVFTPEAKLIADQGSVLAGA